MTQIPQYRAKKIDGDEWVEGYITKELDTYFMVKADTLEEMTKIVPAIDPSTLAIHFSNMIDKNGKKIFASLSKDGVGGDNIRFINKAMWYSSELILLSTEEKIKKLDELPHYEFSCIFDIKEGVNFSFYDLGEGRYEVTGIHKG